MIDQAVERVWQEQRREWLRGNRAPAEDYLCALGPQCSVEERFDVIYGEIMLRREIGPPPTLVEYQNRFPEFAAQLARQWCFDSVADGLDEVENASPTGISTSRGAAEATHDSGPTHPSFRPSATGPLPASIGKYRIVARLDAGGQAEVFRAVHPELDRDVVIKLGHHSAAAAGARLLDEGRILAQLEHPHLARVYDVDFWEGRPYLVMEFVRGRTLEQVAGDRPLPPAEAARLVALVARAAAAAHRQGVLHRDIKPRNILLDEVGRPRLIDFGLARIEHAWTASAPEEGQISGSLCYMPPEQARGDDNAVSERSDVHGLGGVLVYLLTGRPPIAARSFAETLAAAQAGEWDRNALDELRVPPGLAQVCERTLARRPEDRYRSAEELADSLEVFAQPEPGNARPAALWAAAACLLLLLASIAVIGMGSGWFGWSAKPFPPPPTGPLMTLRVWRSQGMGRFRDLVDAVPLKNGDEIKLAAAVPPGYAATLLAFNATEGLKVLSRIPPAAEPRELRFPEQADSAAPLAGRPGTEMLLVCLTAEELDLASVEPPFAAIVPRWPAGSDSLVLRILPTEVQVLQTGRAFGPPTARVDPDETLRDSAEQLRRALHPRCRSFEAILFAHR